MSDRPVVVEPHLVACAMHLEPFRAAWPSGFLPFALHIVQAGMSKVAQEPGAMPSAIASDEARHQALEAAMYRHAPLCEWLGAAVILEAYEFADHPDADWATDGRCEWCSEEGRGTRFEVNLANPLERGPSQLQTWGHVCLRCAAHQRYTDPNHPKRPKGGRPKL